MTDSQTTNGTEEEQVQQQKRAAFFSDAVRPSTQPSRRKSDSLMYTYTSAL